METIDNEFIPTRWLGGPKAKALGAEPKTYYTNLFWAFTINILPNKKIDKRQWKNWDSLSRIARLQSLKTMIKERFDLELLTEVIEKTSKGIEHLHFLVYDRYEHLNIDVVSDISLPYNLPSNKHCVAIHATRTQVSKSFWENYCEKTLLDKSLF